MNIDELIEATEAGEDVVRQINPLMAGKGPVLQAYVVSKLTAMWIGGHHPELRPKAQEMILALIADLVPANSTPLSAFQQKPH